MRVALRRDLARPAIWTRPRAEDRNLLVATAAPAKAGLGVLPGLAGELPPELATIKAGVVGAYGG